MASNTAKQMGSYHHGNLKQALIEAYLTLLQSESADKISLRKLAGYVGVAPTAAYNHFRDKNELIVAVKTRCLIHFADYLEKSVKKMTEPRLRIRNLGKAYFQYSVDQPQYFSILFTTEVEDKYITDDLINAAMRAEAALREAVIDLLKDNELPVSKYNEGLGAFACWSLAHGITTLASVRINRAACAMDRWPREFMLENPNMVRDVFDSMSEVLVEGILARARKNPD